MSDTQWPRYEVFKQDRPGRPHEAIGAVHAPDNEMALLNARDVFVRRPDCHSLWVAPEQAVFKRTAYELEMDPDWHIEALDPDAPTQTYLVFNKQTQRRSMAAVVHVGEVEASSPRQALRQALAIQAFGRGPVYMWWVLPQSALIQSDDADIASMFEPAKDKVYKDQSQYGGRLFASRSRRRPEDIPTP